MIAGGALVRLAQTFAAARVDLRHPTRRPAASAQAGASFQAGRTEGRNAGFRNHAFSKRKRLFLGIDVDMVTRSGV